MTVETLAAVLALAFPGIPAFDCPTSIPMGEGRYALGVHRDDGTIGLEASRVCAPLRALAAGRQPTDRAGLRRTTRAVFVLAHELGHAAGLKSENAADCYAYRRIHAVALSIPGVTCRYAMLLRRVAPDVATGSCVR